MSFKLLPASVQEDITRAIEELRRKSFLLVDGHLEAEVTLSVVVQITHEFEDIVLAQAEPFDYEVTDAVLKEGNRVSVGSVLAFTPGDRARVDEDDIHDTISDAVRYTIEKEAADSLESSFDLVTVEVEDIEITEVVIENQDDVDTWNKEVE